MALSSADIPGAKLRDLYTAWQEAVDDARDRPVAIERARELRDMYLGLVSIKANH